MSYLSDDGLVLDWVHINFNIQFHAENEHFPSATCTHRRKVVVLDMRNLAKSVDSFSLHGLTQVLPEF